MAIGDGAADPVAAGGAVLTGSSSTVATGEAGEDPPAGTVAPGSGWGCGCAGGLGVLGGVGLPEGRGVGELLGEHILTSPRRPGESQGAATAVPAGASAIRHRAKGIATRAAGTFLRVMASTLPTDRQLGGKLRPGRTKKQACQRSRPHQQPPNRPRILTG